MNALLRGALPAGAILRDTFEIAVEALRANRSRTVLTLLSVVIGVSSIIFCVSAGSGLARFIDTQLASLGTDLMWVRPVSDSTDPNQRLEALTYEDAVAVGELPGVAQVGPRASTRVVFSLDRAHVAGELLAVNPQYFSMRNKTVELGRGLLASDLDLRRSVCVVGPGIVDRLLYRTPDPLGRTIKVDGRPFVVVGVLSRSQSTLKTPGLEEEDAVFIPLTTGARQLGLEELDFLFFQPDGSRSREALRQSIHQLMVLRKGPRTIYEVDSLEERMRQVENLIWVAVVVFGSIAGVSLLVAGIGIMNIMLLSVIERTREIGIRKSVGARNRDILIQFFTEATLLSGSGGALGVLVGGAATLGLTLLTAGVVTFSWAAALTAFAFSLSIGVFFGLYPALRAAQLEPVTALAREVT
jgi:putative ABC transport system permease protein